MNSILDTFTTAFYGDYENSRRGPSIIAEILSAFSLSKSDFTESRLNGKNANVSEIAKGCFGSKAFSSCCLIYANKKSWNGVKLHVEVGPYFAFISARSDVLDLATHSEKITPYLCKLRETICGIGYSMPLQFKPTLFAVTSGYVSPEFRDHAYFETGEEPQSWLSDLRTRRSNARTTVRGLFEVNYVNAEQFLYINSKYRLPKHVDEGVSISRGFADSTLIKIDVSKPLVFELRNDKRQQ